MNCDDIEQVIVKATLRSSLPPGAEEHLADCERCRRLAEVFARQGSGGSPSPELLQVIEGGLLSDLRPVQPIAPKRHFFALLAAIFACVVAAGVYRIGAFAFAVLSPLQAGVITGILTISVGLLAYSLVNQMVPGSRHRIPPALLQLCIIVTLALAITVLFKFQHERDFWKHTWGCFRAGTPIAAVAAVSLWLVLRRGAILSPSTMGAATGLFAGLAGTTALEIHCPIMDGWHILVGHLGVAVFGLIAGFVFGQAVESGKVMSRKS